MQNVFMITRTSPVYPTQPFYVAINWLTENLQIQMMIGLEGDLPQPAGVKRHYKMDVNAKQINLILVCEKQITLKELTFCTDATSFTFTPLDP